MSEYQDKIGRVLVDGNYIEGEEFDRARKESDSLGTDLYRHLVDNGYLTKDLFGQAVAESYGIAYADLNTNIPSKEQVFKISEDFAKNYRTVLFDEGKTSCTIATDLPLQAGLIEELIKIFGNKKVYISYSLSEDIDKILLFYQKSLDKRLETIISSKNNEAPVILDEIFKEAVINNASDVHIEPRSNSIRIRLRIDGVLQESATLPKEMHESILNRIKVLSHIRIDEHFSAQDGSIRYSVEGKSVDLRVSIIPTLYGEKIVARVLALYVKGLSLEDLGLNETDIEVLNQASKNPFGMIINVGPTGSGKTTTLYAMLKTLNKTDVNITTIEDPVEYRIDNTNQIQVDPDRDLTFAKGLRSIVRQDPDVILVGEIRDEETAEIAVNAALTGHLLFSTFHANDSATAIPRLLDMNIEPFLLASTLELIIAQRLARKVCQSCRYSYEENTKTINDKFGGKIFTETKTTLYKGKGCEACKGTGFDGRTAIFEHIKATPELKSLILKNPSSDEIWKLAKSQGSKSLFENGIEKVRKGITTVDELLRVAKPPTYEKPKRKTKK